jgi:hypothetical protein
MQLECVAFRQNLPDKRTGRTRWQPRNASRVHPNFGKASRFHWPGTRHVTASFPHNRNLVVLLGTRRICKTKHVWRLQVHYLPIALGNDLVSIACRFLDSPLKDWDALDPIAIDSWLANLYSFIDRDNKAVICTRCRYALQPSGQTVSKHLWERHAVDARRRRELHAFIESVKLPDPNTLCTSSDGNRPHPYLTIYEGLACRCCDFWTTSTELAQRHVAKYMVKKMRRHRVSFKT